MREGGGEIVMKKRERRGMWGISEGLIAFAWTRKNSLRAGLRITREDF